ncbi:MAG: CoB--CoM heterodisulfide reductase iron-sulfur subunit A family protein [Candidatus Latescibacterota bacterium]
MMRIGLFVCHCGINISRTVDVEKVAAEIAKEAGVVVATHYTYVCSTPGQEIILKAIKEDNLDRVIVAACSPRMHETTFRRACIRAGLNPYLCEIANIREQCSWVHDDKELGTQKAMDIIRTTIEKVKGNLPLTEIRVPLKKRALVIGAGIAGIQVALDMANGGHEVVVVEREPCIGGHMAQLSETFPSLDCASCIFTPKVVEFSQHKRITLYAYSEIESLSGIVGDFKVKIRKKARSVDETKCTGCESCVAKCPTKVESEFNRGMALRKAIYKPFPQAVPNLVTIDKEHCRYYTQGKCRVCEKVCPAEAVVFDQEDTFIEEEVGAVVVATGYDVLPKDVYGEYGYGKYKDVIDGLQFERLLSASGPTAGEVKRPSDGMVPKEVVFIQCVGSRDDSKGRSYCSKICCMYTAKHTLLFKHRVHDGKAYVFYMDVRAGGKRYEEFWKRAVVEEGATYLRGRVSKIYEDDGKLIVRGADTLSGTQVEVKADMVVLASAITAPPGIEDLVKKLRIGTDEHKFLSESHVKLRPVETNTAGIFLAGACQAPKDIPDTVAQAGCAASKVLSLFAEDELAHEPVVAYVDEEICSGCGLCVAICPYDARDIDEKKGVVSVKEILCEGCGACVSACPNGASQQRNFTSDQYLAMVDAVTY